MIGTINVPPKIMNLKELVWNKNLSTSDKLAQLMGLKLELNKTITNRHKLTFDIYYDFTTDFESIKSDNIKWKQVVLAIDVIKIIKRWYRNYDINLKIMKSGYWFIEYFRNTIDISKYNMCSIGINFYHKEGYTFKTFILWANKLCKLGVITENKFNSFMEHLERNSNNGK